MFDREGGELRAPRYVDGDGHEVQPGLAQHLGGVGVQAGGPVTLRKDGEPLLVSLRRGHQLYVRSVCKGFRVAGYQGFLPRMVVNVEGAVNVELGRGPVHRDPKSYLG